MLDDIHLISGRKKSQEELLFLFNLFYDSRKQIVVAGIKPPTQISKLLPQLRSRLEWGILSEIHPPSQKTKMKIIEKKAKEENLHIPDDVIFFLANTTNDIKILTQYLISLQTYSSLYQRRIDMSIVKSVIKNRFLSKTNIYDIQKVTADHFNISLSELISNKKGREFSYPRHIAMYFCRNLTYLPYKKIGEAFGNKNHTTVIHAIKHIEKDKKLKKRSVMEDINKLNSLLS
jgi:chromosomal replication initiator protein